MKATDRLIYRNENGQEIEMSFFSTYMLKGINESLNNSIVSTKQVGKDGANYASSTFDPRTIKIRGAIKLGKHIDVLERRLRNTFNPKLAGTLIFRTLEVEKRIAVRVEEVVEFKREKGASHFTVELIAHDPYWRETDRVEYLAMLSARLAFPLVIPKNTGVVFGLRQSILETEIINIGDVASGFRVVFRAKGLVSNPEVENKITGEKIRVLIDMEKGDVVEIVNTRAKKMINYNGVKAFKHLDRHNSTFFSLDVGKNLIGYNAEVNAINLDVILYYSPLYLGR